MQGNSKTQGTSFGCGLRTTLNRNQGTSCEARRRVQDAAPAPPALRSGPEQPHSPAEAVALALRWPAVPRLGRRRRGCLRGTEFLRGEGVLRETEVPRGGGDPEELRGILQRPGIPLRGGDVPRTARSCGREWSPGCARARARSLFKTRKPAAASSLFM